MKLRDLTSSGEHMNYLLDNGYIEDAKRLFEEQFNNGRSARQFYSYMGLSKSWPYAMQIGYNNPNDPVDDWINLYFEDVS